MAEFERLPPAAAAGTVRLGGDLLVNRLGFGALHVTGKGGWGEPEDPDRARAVLRRALDLGVTLIDTADAYGPEVSERLIAETLAPYPPELVIATKGGHTRSASGGWGVDGRPEYLRSMLEGSLRRLRLERIDLYQLHRVDPEVSIEESVGLLAELRAQGKIRHIGLCNVDADQLQRARRVAPIVAVQNRYNLADRASDDVVDLCEREGLAFLPWHPLPQGADAPGEGWRRVAERLEVTPAQVALAWLLRRSPAMAPIPGTSSVAHLEQNVRAAALELDDAAFVAAGGG